MLSMWDDYLCFNCETVICATRFNSDRITVWDAYYSAEGVAYYVSLASRHLKLSHETIITSQREQSRNERRFYHHFKRPSGETMVRRWPSQKTSHTVSDTVSLPPDRLKTSIGLYRVFIHKMFLFFWEFQPGCSYKRCSYKKKRCTDAITGANKQTRQVVWFTLSTEQTHIVRRCQPMSQVRDNSKNKRRENCEYVVNQGKWREQKAGKKKRVRKNGDR